MALNSLFPGYILIDYHSTKAAHKMTLPTRAWNPLGGTGGQGGYEAWDASDRDAIAMATDLATLLNDYAPGEVTFDKWTAYTIASVGAPAIPKAGGAFSGLTGGAVTPGWWQAVQSTLTLYDTGFNTVKLVTLDATSLNHFGPTAFGDLDVKEAAIFAEFILNTNAWSSRANLRPATFRSYRTTINNELEKQYWG